MNRSLFHEYTVLLFAFTFIFSVSTNEPIKVNGGVVKFSDDFEVFLKDLGTILTKSKTRVAGDTISSNQRNDLLYKTTPRGSRNNRNFNTEKAALNDILMMKLVSYYEDKYRLAYHDSSITNTPRSTNFDDRTPKKFNIFEIVQGSSPDVNRIKSVLDSEKVLSFLDSLPYTPSNMGPGPQNRQQNLLPEVLNFVEYAPSNKGKAQDVFDETVISPNIMTKLPNTAIYTNTNIGRMGGIPQYESKVQSTIDYTSPYIQEVQLLDYNVPDNPDSGNIEKWDGRSSSPGKKRTNERGINSYRSYSGNDETQSYKDSTRDNDDKMRILIGTSPIAQSTAHMRKNIDNPISEVVVL